MNSLIPARRPLFPARRMRGLGDAGPARIPVDLASWIPWLIVGGFVIYGISALRHRPRRAKRRRAAKPPIVVSRGIGTLAGFGLLALGGLVVYDIVEANKLTQ